MFYKGRYIGNIDIPHSLEHLKCKEIKIDLRKIVLSEIFKILSTEHWIFNFIGVEQTEFPMPSFFAKFSMHFYGIWEENFYLIIMVPGSCYYDRCYTICAQTGLDDFSVVMWKIVLTPFFEFQQKGQCDCGPALTPSWKYFLRCFAKVPVTPALRVLAKY